MSKAQTSLVTWIVWRTPEELARLPVAPGGGGQDRTVDPAAMAAHIRFAGTPPAMPTLLATPEGREALWKGVRLLTAVRAAGHDRPIPCLWRAPAGTPPPTGAESFTAAYAEALGAGAATITFAHPLTAAEGVALAHIWPIPPEPAATSVRRDEGSPDDEATVATYGWRGERATRLRAALAAGPGYAVLLTRTHREVARIAAVDGRSAGDLDHPPGHT